MPFDAAGTFSCTRRDEVLSGLNYTIWTSITLECGAWVEDTGAAQVEGSTGANGVETVAVTISAGLPGNPMLFGQRLGLALPAMPELDEDAELALYRHLQERDAGDAYSAYNALLRTITSFTRSLAQRLRAER